MGRTYPEIDDTLAAFLRRQHVFFVASAPLAGSGHVNLSPKGLDSFAVVDRHTVAYLDLTGSGVETIAHLRENGRIVLMFCAFDGPPKIVRLHGHGEVLSTGDVELRCLFPQWPGERSIIRVRVERISDSCGYGVPLYSYEGQRDQLPQWIERKGPEGIAKYHIEKNGVSIDGLPGLDGATAPSSTRR